VLIGLTILAFRYEGLREKDFILVLRLLRDTLENEGGPYKDRPSCQRFEQWVLNCGKVIRGSKKRDRRMKPAHNQSITGTITPPPPARRTTEHTSINIFSEIFSETDDMIWPLQLVDPRDQEQFKVLYPLMKKLPHSVMYYLNELIFPEVLAHQGLKLSTCGQELGGNIHLVLANIMLPSSTYYF
jgi:hypothetical protein